jgi:hypothetical protein
MKTSVGNVIGVDYGLVRFMKYDMRNINEWVISVKDRT